MNLNLFFVALTGNFTICSWLGKSSFTATRYKTLSIISKTTCIIMYVLPFFCFSVLLFFHSFVLYFRDTIYSCQVCVKKKKIGACNFLIFLTPDKCSAHAVNLLVDVLYSPYIPYLLDYPALQQTFLAEQLQATRLVNISSFLFCFFHYVE